VFVRESRQLSLTELGKTVNREIAPLSRAAQSLIEQNAGDVRLKSLIEETRSALLECQNVYPDLIGSVNSISPKALLSKRRW
jgi:DNA-binding transcriptional LysR family regulator